MQVGILALQGDFAEHAHVLDGLGMTHKQIRGAEDLTDITHLIIPGGESTVMSRFLFLGDLGAEITNRANNGSLSIYGTCAGAILLAKSVVGPHPVRTLELMDITIERNAYGSQLQSFDTDITAKGISTPVHASFIRAPIITAAEANVDVLATYGEHPILVRQGRLLAGTFHPEARGEQALHRFFLSL